MVEEVAAADTAAVAAEAVATAAVAEDTKQTQIGDVDENHAFS